MADDVLTVGLTVRSPTITFPYAYGRWKGAVEVTYPEGLASILAGMANAVGLGIATYLAQLCLAPRVRLGFPVSTAMVEAMTPIAGMLYDVRHWKDGRPLTAPPLYEFEESAECLPVRAPLTPGRTLLLWSGGKDSTLSAILLRDNGYDVRAMHLTANSGVETLEREAVLDLGRDLDLSPVEVGYDHPDFVPFSTAHATPGEWNDFPRANLVPFGRDLATAILSLPVAAAYGASSVSMGHDNECRNAYFDHGGRSVPRNDVESTRGALALEAYARRFVLDGIRFLPPVSGLPELRILHEMLVGHPDLMARTAFCFWGRNCGRCSKCLRYYLAQRVFGADVLRFDTNPLAGTCPELDDILRPDAIGVLFQKQVLYCLGRLIERGDIRPEETGLAEFADTRYREVAPLLDRWAHELLAVGSDPQLPDAFEYRLRAVREPSR